MSASIAVESSKGTPPCEHEILTTVTTVKANNEPVAVVGDFIGLGSITTGAGRVNVEGKAVAYVGSLYTKHPAGEIVHSEANILTGEEKVQVGLT